MNRLMRVIGQVMAGLTVVGVCATAAWAALEGNVGASSTTAQVLSGTIASVDPQHSLLKVKIGLFAQSDIIVRETTKISRGAQEMKFEDLRPGDPVTITYDDANGKRIARSLMVGSAAAPSEPQPGSQTPAAP